MMAGTNAVPAIPVLGGNCMTTYRDYTKEEVARRGRDIYDRSIRPEVAPGDKGKYVTIDIETGEWVMGEDSLTLADQLHARHPEAALFTLRIGQPATVRMGGRADVRP
jgi:hypothetical protein